MQSEMARRKAIGRKYSGNSVLSSRLICGDCGEYFGSKVWHHDQPYRKTIWRCNGKYAGTNRCQTPNLDEDDIKNRFVEAFNEVLSCKEMVLADLQVVVAMLTDYTELDNQIASLTAEIEVVTELTRRCVIENSQTAINQGSYQAKYAELEHRFEAAKEKMAVLQKQREDRLQRAEVIAVFMYHLAEREYGQSEFDDRLWLASVEKAVVNADGSIAFCFYGGVEIRK